MSLLDARRSTEHEAAFDAPEAIIREARRRARRRRLNIALLVLVVVGVAAFAAGASGGGDHRGATTSATSLPKGAPSVDTRAFAHEGLLAFASRGALYVLDGTTGIVREVGHERSGAEEPSFSHDGRFLAYLAAGRETSITDFGPQAPFAPVSGPLVLARSDGSAARRVRAVGEVSVATWSPSADLLLAVTGTPYDGSAVWVVSPDGTARKLLSAFPIYGAGWSPDGQQVAVAVGNGRGTATTLETLSIASGQPTRWASSPGPAIQWLVPLGWWKDQGIGLWVGGRGTVPGGGGSLDGAPLLLARAPGAPLRRLDRTPPTMLVPAASARSGWLALDEQVQSFGRLPWSKKAIETCAPRGDRCATVPEPADATAYDPVWSPGGHTLAFVEAPVSTTPSFFDRFVRSWYASGRLFLLKAGATRPVAVPHSLGATAPAWSPDGRGLLYVANDALYLVGKAGETPLRIAGPLLPAREWASTYYGGIDWRFLFAWAA
ncbi:MAG: hypothetical protein M0010_02520 [Actinomycetota bacterium]|nr:hypothetical protein [Actinomycetota bacterium]